MTIEECKLAAIKGNKNSGVCLVGRGQRSVPDAGMAFKGRVVFPAMVSPPHSSTAAALGDGRGLGLQNIMQCAWSCTACVCTPSKLLSHYPKYVFLIAQYGPLA